jgi:hypothetical protein
MTDDVTLTDEDLDCSARRSGPAWMADSAWYALLALARKGKEAERLINDLCSDEWAGPEHAEQILSTRTVEAARIKYPTPIQREEMMPDAEQPAATYVASPPSDSAKPGAAPALQSSNAVEELASLGVALSQCELREENARAKVELQQFEGCIQNTATEVGEALEAALNKGSEG